MTPSNSRVRVCQVARKRCAVLHKLPSDAKVGLGGHRLQVAVDWVTGNVYFVDMTPSNSRVRVCHVARKRCAVLQKLPSDAKITALVVDPSAGRMFYCVTRGLESVVWSASLAGRHMKDLTTVRNCTGLAADSFKRQLYVAETGPAHIIRMDYEGEGQNDHRLPVTDLAADFFKRQLYVAETGPAHIIRMDYEGEGQIDHRLPVTGLAADSFKRQLYVAKTGPAHIIRMDYEGEGQIDHRLPVTGLAADSFKRQLYVAETGPAHIIRMDYEGEGQNDHRLPVTGLAADSFKRQLYVAETGPAHIIRMDYEGEGHKKILADHPQLQAPHGLAIFEEHIYYLVANSFRLSRCLIFGPQHCETFIYRVLDANTFVLRHESLESLVTIKKILADHPQLQAPHGLAIFEEHIYYLVANSFRLSRCLIFGPQHCETFIYRVFDANTFELRHESLTCDNVCVKKILADHPQLQAPHGLAIFEEHIYYLVANSFRLSRCLIFGPQHCETFIYRVFDANTFVLRHESLTCDNVCVLEEDGHKCFKKILADHPQLQAPHGLAIFEEHIYYLVANSFRLSRCLIFGPQHCETFIYRVFDANTFVLRHETLTCDNVCVLEEDGSQMFECWRKMGPKCFKKILADHPQLQAPHGLAIFEEHIYYLVANSFRLSRCLIFGPQHCETFIYRVFDANTFVLRHESVQRDDVENECDAITCDHVCVLEEDGAKCLCDDGSLVKSGECRKMDKKDLPLFNGWSYEDLMTAHSVTFTVIFAVLGLVVVYLCVFVYYHFVYVPKRNRQSAYTEVRFQNTSMDNEPFPTDATVQMNTSSASGPPHEFVNPLQFVRNMWHTSFRKQTRPNITTELPFDVPAPASPPQQDLSDTESDLDERDSNRIIRNINK
ncbi:hypothetical protein PYW07_009687 [Mythimna separata]|uniref:Vitellogenin receptor n=1 Tax=Mythimna separata TaxID=271217 RepID=A0AAD7YCB5_MYTSE|nr:hypothetical protein PYW07_009687 [Mythimna separata]